MTIRKIARLGEPILRKSASPVAPDALGQAWLQTLIDDMVETMRDADGAGLAAPQVYAPWQLCVIEVVDNPRYPNLSPIPLTVLINPRLTPLGSTHDVLLDEESVTMYEGCLSVPGLRGRVSRPREVRVQALRPDGTLMDERWSGVRAAIVQHEVDHLHGTLFIERADSATLCFTREYERYVPLAERVVDGRAGT